MRVSTYTDRPLRTQKMLDWHAKCTFCQTHSLIIYQTPLPQLGFVMAKLVKEITGYKVKYECPKCGETLKNPIKDAGSIDTCPNCNATFSVPGDELVARLRKKGPKSWRKRSWPRPRRRESGRRERQPILCLPLKNQWSKLPVISSGPARRNHPPLEIGAKLQRQ